MGNSTRSGEYDTRFWDRVRTDDESGCWLWTGYIRPAGYGEFWVKGKKAAHRWAYERFVGPIPEGLQLDHLCRVRHCVNPDHLEPVTNWENTRRGVGFAARRYVAEACERSGHPLTGENMYLHEGRRRCKECRRESNRRWWRENGQEWRRKRKAAKADGQLAPSE